MKFKHCFTFILMTVIVLLSFSRSKAERTRTDYTLKDMALSGPTDAQEVNSVVNSQLFDYDQNHLKKGKLEDFVLEVAGVGIEKQKNRLKGDLEKKKADSYNKIYEIDIEGSHFLGREDAGVTLIVFFDFKCPFCERGYKIFKKLVEEFPDDLKFVFMHLPLDNHVNAEDFAAAAEAAGEQGKFFEMVDLMFEKRIPYSEERVIELAKKLSLDIDKFKKDIDGLDMLTKVYLGAEEAKSHKITATPTVILNKRRIKNSPDINYFKKLIQEEIDKSKKTIN